MSEPAASLWIVVPAGQQASGAWIDDTLKERAAEKGLSAKVPAAGDFKRQRVEVIAGPDAEERLAVLFYRRGWTDGLPIVAPTTGRVKEMLRFSPMKAADVLGEVDPLKGVATVEKVAANAVMAGCRPEHFPVVLAAVSALIDPAFNMRGVQTTDENVAPLLVVSGPIAQALDINSSFGALGPGWRANAAIGRALRLVMNNIGGGWPGAVSFAGLGHPGRYTLCLAETATQCPWPPLHVEAGLAEGASAVTVTRAESIVNVTGGLAEIASVMGSAASGFQVLWSGRPTVILAPATAADCAKAGMSRDDVKRRLYEMGRWPIKQWQDCWLGQRIVVDGRWPDWVLAAANAGQDIPAVRAPDDIVVVVAGGDIPIPQHAYCPSWGFPPCRLTREVVLLPGFDRLLASAEDDERRLMSSGAIT